MANEGKSPSAPAPVPADTVAMLTLTPRPSPPASPASRSTDWIATLLHTGDPSRSGHVALATPQRAGWQELTYAGLDRRSATVAAWLMGRGVGPGQRVLLHADPSGSWVASFLGILRAGAVAVPLDPRLTANELAPIVARSAPVAAVVAGRLRPVIDGVGLGPAVLDLDDVAAPEDPGRRDAGLPTGGAASSVVRAMDDAACVVWTSGTTGQPKGVTLTYANLAYAVAASVEVQHLDRDDRWLSVLPLNHLLELTCGVLGCLATGATLSFSPTLMPGEITELLAGRRITRMMVVPLLARLLRPELERRPPAHLRALFAGGAPLDPALVDAYAAFGVPLLQGYGLTETSPTVAMNSADHHRRGSVGRPLPGTEVRIDGPSGPGAGPGAGPGEILVRSPAVMAGYWDDDALTREAVDPDGWLHTGDLGLLDGDGFLFVTGRAKDLIVLESGKKVQPEEVELVLQRSRHFADVCVVGLPIGGRSPAAEQVGAVVVPHHPMPEEEVQAEVARLTAGLSGYKRPRLVDVWDHALPLTAKRSVRRAEVARQAAERLRHSLVQP